jgi:hypothetical protein
VCHKTFACCAIVSLGLLPLPRSANAQVLLSPAGGQGNRVVPNWSRGHRLPSDTIQMLRLPQIADELGLRDEQKDAIGKLAQEMQKQIQEVFRSTDFSGADMGRIMQEAQRAIRRQSAEKLEELLLPDQLTRLKQIRVQASLKNQGARALLSGELADAIRLSDKQKTQLQQVHAKKQEELQAEIEALQAKYRQDTLNEVLTKSQLRDLQKLAGEQYEIQRPDYQSIYQAKNPPAKATTESGTEEVPEKD